MKLTRDKISKLRRVKNQSYRRFHRKKNTDVTTTTFRKNNRAIEQLFKTVKHYVDKKFIEKHKKERIRKRLLKLQKQLGGGDEETGTGTEIDVLPIQLNVITALETELANSSNDAASNVNSNKEQVSVIASPLGDNQTEQDVTKGIGGEVPPVVKSDVNNNPTDQENTNTSQQDVPVVDTPEKLPDIPGDLVLSVEKIKVDENFTASKVLKAENKIVQIIKDNTPISISGVSNYFTIIGLLYGKFRPPPKEEGGANETAEFDLGVGMSVGIGTKSTPDGMFIKHLPDIVKKITDKSSDVSIKVASEDGSNEEGVKPGQIYFINDANKAAVITNTNDKNKIGIEALTTKDAFRILLTPYETKQKEGVEQGEIPTKYFYNINDGEEITIVDTLKTLFEEIRKEMAVTDNDKKEKTMENLEKLLKIVKERKQDSEFIDAVKDFKYTAGYDPYGIQLSFKSIKESGLTAHISKVISIENELGIGEQSSEFFPNDKKNMKITITVGEDADKNTQGEIEDLVAKFEEIAAKAKQEEDAEKNKNDKKILEEMKNQVNNEEKNQEQKPTTSSTNATTDVKGGAKHTRRNKKTSHKKTRNNRK
jgi:hypothetical protein